MEEFEFTVEQIVKDMNHRLMNHWGKRSYDFDSGQVKSILLKDLALGKCVDIEDECNVYVFVHRFAFLFEGEGRGRYINVLTFHSDEKISMEKELFMPYEYQVENHQRNGVQIQSMYELEDEESDLIKFLEGIHYYKVFDSNYFKQALSLFKNDGYELVEF